MITKNVKTTSGRLSITIPSDIKEVTIEMVQRLEDETLTDIECLSVFSGIPVETLYNIQKIEDVELFQGTIFSLIKQFSSFDTSKKIETVRIAGKTVKVPSDLRIEPVGAYWACLSIFEDEIKKAKEKFGDDWEKNFSPSYEGNMEIMCHYLYVHVTGEEYSEYKVLELLPDVRKTFAVEFIPIAVGFFLKYLKYKEYTKPPLNPIQKALSLLRGLRILKYLARSIRLTRLPEET